MNDPDLLTVPADRSATPIILFGLDDKSKRHASSFSADLSAAAQKASGLMGMVALPVTTPDLAALAGTLPEGKVFESGRAFVPFVKQPLFDKLAAHLPDRSVLTSLRAAASAVNADNRDTARVVTYPKDWSVIAVGNLVLADETEGWWEAIVEAVTGSTLTLSWRDWPDEPRFQRTRDQVALLPVPQSNAN